MSRIWNPSFGIKNTAMHLKYLFFVIFFTASFFAHSQGMSKSEIKAEIAFMVTEYNLNEEQKDKAYDIIKKREKDVKKIYKDKKIKQGHKRKKIDAIYMGAEGSLIMLLDAEQRKLLFEKKTAKAVEERRKNLNNN